MYKVTTNLISIPTPPISQLDFLPLHKNIFFPTPDWWWATGWGGGGLGGATPPALSLRSGKFFENKTL